MSSMNRTWMMVNKHIPMIKFRRTSGHENGAVHKQGTSTPKSSPIVQEAAQPIFLNITEDWQLPRKYKRKPLTEEEMEYINRGGPQ